MAILDTVKVLAGRARSSQRRLALLAGVDGSSPKGPSRWLTNSGLEVASADTFAHALELCDRLRPDIVLADMAFGDGNAQSLCQVLRHRPDRSDVPVLAFCAGRHEVEAALEAGANDVLERPFHARVACLRAQHLVQLAETAFELSGARAEMERLRKANEEERRERSWREHFDALTGLPDSERFERAL